MKIEYLGHSCFALTDSAGTRIVTDPYGDVGFFLPRNLRADAVTVSHGHYDHCNLKAVGGEPAVFDRAGSYTFRGVKMTAVESWHDNAGGRLRGKNLIFKFCIDGLNVCHLGDLGEECTDARIETILPVDVLLIPVGGVYTVDHRQAREYVRRLKPSVVIPMHYLVEGLNIGLRGVEAFLGLFSADEATVFRSGSEIVLAREDLAGETTKIIVMER